MSLRHYKSNFLPDVDFSTDGRLSFSQERSDGTFPLSARGLRKYAADDSEIDQRPKEHFESIDSRRRFQKNSNLYRTNSVRSSSTGTASSRLQRNFDLSWLSDPIATQEDSQKISKLDLENGHVQYNPRASFGSADSKIARKKLRDMDKLEIAQVSTDSTDVDEAPLVKENKAVPVIERPPVVIFLIIGSLLVLFGILNTVFIPWHLYWCAIWTGAIVLIVGVLGICHGGSYFRPWQNWSYVVVGFFASAAAAVSVFLILMFLVPFLRHLPDLVHSGVESVEEPDFFSSGEVNFTRWHPPVVLSGAVLVWLSLVFPAVIFLLILASLHTTYGAMLVFSNFWDCEYRTTGVCDHRRHPFWFNPVDYLRLGQACLVIGMVCVVISFEIPDRTLYWMPIASPAMTIVAAFISFCHGKRPDNISVGIAAVLFELLSLAGLAIAVALLTLGCVKDVEQVKWHTIEGNTYITDSMFGIHIASLAAYGVYVILTVVIASYVIGILVMHFRRLCSSDSQA